MIYMPNITNSHLAHFIYFDCLLLFRKVPIRLFTGIQLQSVSICCLKGQHPLTKLQDLKVYTLSFPQLFLQLLETFWGLGTIPYTKKSSKTAKPINTPPSGYILARYMSYRFLVVLHLLLPLGTYDKLLQILNSQGLNL